MQLTNHKPIEIWFLEDDEQQIETLERLLFTKLLRDRTTIRLIASERAFKQEIEGMQHDPDLIIGDVMLPWTQREKGVSVPPPPDAQGDTAFMKAGVRCWKELRQKQGAADFPARWIYYTNLQATDFDFDVNRDEWTFYVNKDRPVSDLLDKVVQFAVVDAEWAGEDEDETKELSKSSEYLETLLRGLRTPLAECFPMPCEAFSH